MIAKRPPMGWNSWDCYGAGVTEETVRANAEYMAEHMKKYGWEYVVVDIEWYQPTAKNHEYAPFSDVFMDEYGRLLPAVEKFPSATDGRGFTALAEYVHSLGLKFGIHIMRGMPRMAAHNDLPILGSNLTARQVADPHSICEWNPDMYGLKCKHFAYGAMRNETEEPGSIAYYNSIFQLYASWGVDFIKIDDIAREYPHCEREIEIVSEACHGAGRDMVLSLSPGPAPLAHAEHLKQYANMWRITDDFWDEWRLLLEMFDRAEEWCTHSGPGHWPDADMLPVGALRQDYIDGDAPWTKFTEDEQITMLTLWCMMRSPLMVGADLPKNDEFTLQLLTNQEVLDIQTKSHCAHQLYRTSEQVVWMAPFKDGAGCYLAIFNISDVEAMQSVDLSAYEMEQYTIRTELWSGTVAEAGDVIQTKIPAHGAVVYKLV